MKVRFFNPHSGIGGAILPLPEKIKSIVDEINGKNLDLHEIRDLIFEEVDNLKFKSFKVEVCETYLLLVVTENGKFVHEFGNYKFKEEPKHNFRLIDYEIIKEEKKSKYRSLDAE